MKMSDGVEWGAHCVLLLGALPPEARLSGKAMAQFHGVPESYLLKHLKALAKAEILVSTPGPAGGYGLARALSDITLLDIVSAVDGDRPAFRCSEIRRRGPCSIDDDRAYPRPCGINRAMLRAERDYRAALGREKMSDLLAELATSIDPRVAALGEEWLSENVRSTPQ